MTVCLIDEFGLEFFPELYDDLDLQVEHNSGDVVHVEHIITPSILDYPDYAFVQAKLQGCKGRVYQITGLRVGGAVLTFSTSMSYGRFYSDPYHLQVRLVMAWKL